MKNITLPVVAIALCALFSCAPKHNVPQGMFVIRGSLVNVPDSSVIRLYESDGSISSVIGTDTLTNGMFEFCDSIPADGKFITIRSPHDGFSQLPLNLWVVSQTYIEIKGDGGLIVDWEVISTHPSQKEESDYVKATLPEALEYAKISVEENRYRQIAKENMRKTGKYSMGEYTDIVDSLENLSTALYTKIMIKELEHLKTVAVTDHWLHSYFMHAKILQYFKTINEVEIITRIEELYTMIPQEQLASEMGETITSYIHPPKEVCEGDEMVDGELFDAKGNIQTLAQFNGKYILLDFWSAGCGPCISAIPEMEQIAEEYDNVAVVSISIDNESTWRNALESLKLKGLQRNELSAKNKLYNSYGNSKGIPYYVIISPEGKVLKKWAGYGNGILKRELKRAFEE